MPRATQLGLFVLVRVLLAAGFGAVLGLIFHRPAAGAALVLALYLGWQLMMLARLDEWLRLRNFSEAPDAGGLWGDVLSQVARLHRRKQFHKRRLFQFIKQLRRSTEAIPDGIVMLDRDREIVWFNSAAARLVHLRRADLGLRIDHLIRQPEFIRYLEAGHFERAVLVRDEGSRQSGVPGSSSVYLTLQIVPYAEQQRLLIIRDVTREARLEAVRKDFIANASHELRSPLTVISGYLETLSQDPTIDEEIRAPLREMRRQADRMGAIVRDLLELSRLEDESRALARDAVDVGAMMSMFRKDVLARAEHPAHIHIEAASTARILGDEREIHSAFSNLVDNAAKFTPAEGSLWISWTVDSRGGHFAVKDSGIGILAEHLPRLTERFYRVDAGRSRERGGSGLGLAIVKHVMQRHGGSLEIESELGKGSTFTCHFPPERLVQAQETA